MNISFLVVGPVNSCDTIENCITFKEEPCDSNGKRRVCIEWVPDAPRDSCTLDPEFNFIDQVCVAHGKGLPISVCGTRLGFTDK